MPDPEDVTRGLGDMVRQGLGMFGQGVNTIAQVLKSGDAAVKEVDGALTGGHPRPAPPAIDSPASDEEIAQQVVSLIQRGREEAARAGDPRRPGVVGRFQDLMRLLFQVPLSRDGGLTNIMPSPAEAVRTGLRDLRGSMALVRLANGTGSLADVEEVARFAEDLVGRVQQGLQAVQAPEPPPDQTPSGANPAPQKASRKRTPRRRKAAPDSAAVAFAQAVAEEMGDAQVTGWAEEFTAGKITEPTWVSRLTDHAARTQESLDDVLRRAQGRMQGKSGG